MTRKIDSTGKLLMAAVQNNPALMRLAEDTVIASGTSRGLDLLRIIETWQARAANIPPPEGINSARGGLPGPAFFPEAYGLSNPSGSVLPSVMVVGHNWGCAAYRDEIDGRGREDDKPTWRGLSRVLAAAGGSIAEGFMTNWFVGLLPGALQCRRRFLLHPEPEFENACRKLLLDQIAFLRPRAVLLLGLEVARHAHEIFEAAAPWANARNWAALDRSAAGPIISGAAVLELGIQTNLCALIHPSLAWPNRRYRRSLFPEDDDPEASILRSALGL
jgi:hypothetical protein